MVDHPRLADYEKRLVKWHQAETKKVRRQAKEPHGDEGGDQESSSSEEEHDHGLTFVALDNMDEDNRKEWMKEGKMKQLSGLAGCKRMAKDILRADREAARDAYVNGDKKGNSSVSGVRLRCTGAPWARRFLPGSEESGSTMPASTTRVGLTCPPKRQTWVAQYPNKQLQAEKETAHAIKVLTGRASVRAPSIPDYIVMVVGAPWLVL